MDHKQLINNTLASIVAPARVAEVLRDLHQQALIEEPYISTDDQPERKALDKFVALDPDKCAVVYLLLRATGARHVIEAGTSFGLSTIYLALAVGQNVAALGGAGKVIATENEETKAAKAREHWARAGADVEKWIELRQGDLRETLKKNLPEKIDFVLFDIWTPLALPTLKLLERSLKTGALLMLDNTDAAQTGYAELMEYVDCEGSMYRRTTVPYTGGLGLITYCGE